MQIKLVRTACSILTTHGRQHVIMDIEGFLCHACQMQVQGGMHCPVTLHGHPGSHIVMDKHMMRLHAMCTEARSVFMVSASI